MPSDYDPNTVKTGISTLQAEVSSVDTTFVVNDPGSSPAQTTKTRISDTDNDGKYQPSSLKIQDGEEPVTRTVVLQMPNAGSIPDEFGDVTWDHDKSGTASTWVIENVSVNQSKTERATISLDLVLKTYQG